MPVRVVIAEDNALLREGLARLLDRSGEVAVTATAVDLPSLMAVMDSDGPPDVVVTDIRMPPTHTDEGIQVAAWLREHHREVGVLVLSQHVEPSYALALLDAGSEGRGYLLKERVADVEDLVAAIHTVAAGGSVVDPKVVEALVSASRRPQRNELDRLTPREMEVLSEMAQGKSNAAIAATLVLSERAVEKHSNSIFSKLDLSEESNVNRRVKAVLLFLHQGR